MVFTAHVIMNEATMHCMYTCICLCRCVMCVYVCVYRYVVHDGVYTFVVFLQRCAIIITLYSWRKGVG